MSPPESETVMPLVTIYHNISTDEDGRPLGMLDGYTPGHALVPVAQYTAEAMNAASLTFPAMLEDAFEAFNVGETGIAAVYRRAGNRSLSVGDVVQFSGRDGDGWFACASLGWNEIQPPEWFALGASRHGTTALHHRMKARTA